MAAGRARPGSEHLFSLPLMRPSPGQDEVGRPEHRGKFSERYKRKSGGVSEPRGAPSSQREEGKLTPAERQGRERGSMPATAQATHRIIARPPYLKSL